MAISSRLALWEQKIREEDRSPRPSSPPLLFSVIPGGFIKQLVRETEKESKGVKLKEKIQLREQEDPLGKCDDSSAQPLARQARDILQVGGTMGSKGEVLQNGLNGEKHEEGVAAPLPARKTMPFKRAVGRASLKKPTPPAPETAQPGKAPGQEHQSKGGSPPAAAQRPGRGLQRCPEGRGKEGEAPGKKGLETARKEKQPPRTKAGVKGELGGVEKEMEDVKKGAGESKKEAGVRKGPGEAGGEEERELSKEVAQEPGPGRMDIQEDPEKVEGEAEEMEEPGASPDSDTAKAHDDVWYEAEKVWLVRKDGFTLATQLKPDVGTPELPAGRVRVRVEADGTVIEVDEEHVHRTNPSSLDFAEDVAALISPNESSVINTLQHRYRSQLSCTYAGPSLVTIRPSAAGASCSAKAFKGKRDSMPPHVCSVAQRAYWNLLTRCQDQTLLPLGRSGAGKTTCCQSALEYLVGTAGSVDNRVSVEKIQAMFTVLKAFGSVTTQHHCHSTRFSMVMSLDFNATGRITAAHLQTLMLERVRVARQPDGEGNFNVFPQMLAGLDITQKTMLHLHQAAESNSFGIGPVSKAEDKQKASASFAQLQVAMETLGITAEEKKAVWRVLAGIYHLGAAGACKVGRKQFMTFESANNAAEVLGCDYEELATAVFKHHLKQIIEQVTSGGSRPSPAEDKGPGPKMMGVECVEGMASGLYEELFAVIVSLINRSFASSHLSMASIMVVDTPGFHNPRHQKQERAATFEELCHNYVHEQLQALFYKRTFEAELERYREENVEVPFDLPEQSPLATLSVVDQNASQLHVAPGGQADDPKGLFWILDEEVLIQGSGDSVVLDRLCSYFAAKGAQKEEDGVLRKCEQVLQFEISHQLGQDPVRYDLAGWVSKAKPNLSAQNAIQVLQQSRANDVRNLFQPRSKMPQICRSVAGLEGYSQQALQRIGCVRKTFASSFAVVKRKSVCAQIKLQMDALSNLVKRSQVHFIHCLVPRVGVDEADVTTSQPGVPGEGDLALDVPTLRVQLCGAQLLDALRLYRIGYVDHMLLTQFRRRFQVLAQPVMKKYTSAYEIPDENKAMEELFQALDLEKRSIAVGRSQVFLKPGVVSRLEKQRDKLISPMVMLLQAACKGFLSRQKFKRLKIQRLAVRCIQKNLAAYRVVKEWPWWQLLCCLRPMLSTHVTEDQLRAKEEELAVVRRKLETSEQSRHELRQSTEGLESKVLDLTAELTDERYKGEAVCQVLEAERAERLRGARELRELQSKYEQVQKKLESVEKQLEETQQQVQLRELGIAGAGGEEEWQMRFDCAQTEIAFLRKRLAQLEERLESELSSKKELEQKLGEVESAYEGAKKVAQQMRRKCKRLTCDLEDTRVLMESQQSRSHELEKKQKKFDMQLAQALGESAFEKSLREKMTQENTAVRWEMGKLQQRLEQKELETSGLNQRVAVLSSRVQELTSAEALDENAVPALKKRLWDLEASTTEQQKELKHQATTIEQLEQLHLRLEMEIERMKQMQQKELEDKDEELEDVRQSCQRRLRQLEMQLEQEFEEKQMVLHEKQDLEGLVGTLCEQIGHRDFDVEKRLRRDLKRTHALLADVQLLLATAGDPGPSVSKEEVEKLRGQWEESEAKCAEAQTSQKAMAMELETLHVELETISRNKNLVDEQLYQLQHEKADLLKRIDEDQEDLNELMAKHKALIAQSATDIAQIRELQTQLEEVKKEKQSLQGKLQVAQARMAYLEQAMVERSIVSRQEALICDLESKLQFQNVQIKRFEMLVLRLRDSVIKMGEELEKAADSEAREKENAKYYQMRMEEMKADMSELAQRELEASRRRVELEKQVDELSAVRQTLQADLETSIRRIADLQVALEEVQSSDESDAESVQTALESLGSRRETDAQSSVGSTLSLEPGESIKSWLGSAAGWSSPTSTSVAGSLSRQSVGSRGAQSLRMTRDVTDQEPTRLASSLSARREQYGRAGTEANFGKSASPLLGVRRLEYGKSPMDKEETKTVDKVGAISPSVIRRRMSPAEEEKLPSSSSALSEYVEELRRKRAVEKEGMLGLGDASSLPIYQTTGASSLRRCRTFKEEEDFPIKLGADELAGREDGAGRGGLVRSSSLKCVALEIPEPARSPALRRASKFGSYDSLLQDVDRSCLPLSAPTAGADALGTARIKPWRSRLEPSLEEASDADLGKDPLVFQSRRFGDALEEGKERDPFAWKIPTLNYERKTNVDFDDFLPAVPKCQPLSSLSRPVRDRRDSPRPLSVHFEDQLIAGSAAPSELKTVLRQSANPREVPGNFSDSDSSSSITSCKSADSVKSRPRSQRAEGDGCAGKAALHGPGEEKCLEAEGKEDDINSIMMKYLGKD
ncbi:PREDICTED: unconventional myosin-XVIIIb [Crocodylus porosus]|uniref:unconventional myosin-XVIIIb n=1 Tax=Crocodylus porosus TaxID=8502 RepID=UPI0009393C97|nr:PREDICTED: unconventional myosin-XVIIIb [Crocodylus porosus]